MLRFRELHTSLGVDYSGNRFVVFHPTLYGLLSLALSLLLAACTTVVLYLTCPMASTAGSNSSVPAESDARSLEEKRKPSRCEEMLQFSLDRCERLFYTWPGICNR